MSDDELLDQIDTQEFHISAPSTACSPRPSPAVPSPPAGPSRQARAAAAEARLAPRSTGVETGGPILPGASELGARCLREKELEWQKFVERELVGPNSYAQVRPHSVVPSSSTERPTADDPTLAMLSSGRKGLLCTSALAFISALLPRLTFSTVLVDAPSDLRQHPRAAGQHLFQDDQVVLQEAQK